MFSNELEFGQINKINDDFIMGFGDNPTYLDMIMEQLITFMYKNSIRDLALSIDNELFNYVSQKRFKEIYTSMYNKLLKIFKYISFIIVLYKPLHRIKNKSIQLSLIKQYHDSPIGGHLGIRKTILKLKQKYVWKNMRKMIKNHINNCDSCLRNKQHVKIKEEMKITETPGKSFEIVSIDTVGPLRLSNNYNRN